MPRSLTTKICGRKLFPALSREGDEIENGKKKSEIILIRGCGDGIWDVYSL